MQASEGVDLIGLTDKDNGGESFALDLSGGEEGTRIPGFREDDSAVEWTSAIFQFLSDITHTSLS